MEEYATCVLPGRGKKAAATATQARPRTTVRMVIKEGHTSSRWYRNSNHHCNLSRSHSNHLIPTCNSQLQCIHRRKRNQRSHEASKCWIEKLNHLSVECARKHFLLVILCSDILQNVTNFIKKTSTSQSRWRRRQRNNLPVPATNQTLLSGHLQALGYRRAKAAILQDSFINQELRYCQMTIDSQLSANAVRTKRKCTSDECKYENINL